MVSKIEYDIIKNGDNVNKLINIENACNKKFNSMSEKFNEWKDAFSKCLKEGSITCGETEKAMFAQEYKGEELKESDTGYVQVADTSDPNYRKPFTKFKIVYDCDEKKNGSTNFIKNKQEIFNGNFDKLQDRIKELKQQGCYNIRTYTISQDSEVDESLNESAYEDFMNEIRQTDEYHKISKILERAYKALSSEEYKKVYAEAQKVKKEIMASHEGLKESRQNNEFYRGEVIWNYGDEDTFEVGFEGKPREFPSKEDAKKAIDEYRKDPHYLSKYERDYYSGPEEGGYTSTGLILIDSKRYPDYDSAVRALEVKQADYAEDELEYVGNDIFEDSYGYVYNVEHDKGSEHSPAKSWAEAELGEDFVARQADEVLEGAVGNLSDKEVDKLLGTLRKAKKLLGVNRIEDIYYVQSEDDPEDWQRELEFTKENINSKVDFFDSKKYNISVVREKLDNGSIALYFADEDSVNRYHDITGNYYDDNFDYSV